MTSLFLKRTARSLTVLLCLALMSTASVAQKKIPCPDGEHIEIDVKQISIQYDASSFAGTLSSLSVLGARLEIAPKKLQEAAVATQQWDEFLKGLVAGYNSCAVTKQQYADGLKRIYPRLQEDATGLEEIRKAISAGQKADTKRLQQLIDSFYANLKQFAQVSGKEIILERIEALSQQVASGQQQLLQQQKTDTDFILDKLNELKETNKQAPLATPAEVGKQVSELRKTLLAKADEAEAAYNKGYELLHRYRFQQAIPYLQQAVAAVRLPDFYLALGRAYTELPDSNAAEKVLREGLELAGLDEQHEAQLSDQLGIVLRTKGDLDDALTYTLQALEIDENICGAEGPIVAVRANNIGQVLQEKGDLNGALKYTQRALTIDEKVYGPDSSQVAIRANNIGAILHDKGDLDGALSYSQRALTIDEKVYGLDSPQVAIGANNIGAILKDKGDLDGALEFTQRALTIDEKVYGPDYPTVAIFANNIGQILKDKRDSNGALKWAQRALKIEERAYGPNSPSVATVANNIGSILLAKGDLDGALKYTQRALMIDQKAYGPDHPNVAADSNNIGQILLAKGDLDGALKYSQRALEITQRAYGLDNPKVGIVSDNIGLIFKRKGNLKEALSYSQRALKIFEKTYGPDNPNTKTAARNVKAIEQAIQLKVNSHK